MKNIENADVIVREILNSCGGQKFLHIGAGNGQLVQELLSSGMDAQGIDDSSEAVAYGNSFMPERFTLGVASKLPYADKAFDTTVALYSLEYINPDELTQAVREIKRVTKRSIYLRVTTGNQQENDPRAIVLGRNEWERIFFAEGLRKHPSYYLINDYEALGRESGEAIILLECIPETALERYPLEALKEERDLHMDMTREAGERSDAHIARYQWAATFVRPGDTVLDAACGLGYGSYLLQCGTMAGKTIGIDGSNYAIDYANLNFVPNVSNLSFSAGMLPEALYDFADHSVDVVVSFETLEHISDPETVLKEFQRILTPGGRIIVSVPNDWSDETGEDPNPFHLHVYTLDKLRDQIKAQFQLENITVQSATHYKEKAGSKNWVAAKRELYSIPTDAEESTAPASEWWLAVGMKSPLNGEEVVYHDTQHKTFSDPDWNVTAFSRDYKNPWLVRAMVDIGWRQRNDDALKELAEIVYDTNHDNSADTGAALCVRAYQLLNGSVPSSIDELKQISERIDEYVLLKPVTPHAIRWMISLHFVMARLWLKAGLHSQARTSFEKCVAIDPLIFSPLLANRVVEARLYLGVIRLNSNDESGAREEWAAGIELAYRALNADWNQSLGDLRDPVEFGLPELSSILDYASNCAYALVNLDSFKDKPWWWLQLRRSPQAQAASMRALNVALRSQISSLNKYAALLEGNNKSVTSLQEENTQLLNSLEGNNKSLETLQQENQRLLNSLEGNNQALVSLQSENIRLLRSLEVNSLAVSELQAKNAELNETIEGKELAHTTLESENKILANSLEENSQALDVLKGENSYLLTSLDENSQALDALREENKKLIASLDENSQELAALQDRNTQLWNFLAIISGCEVTQYPAMDKKIEIIKSLYQLFNSDHLTEQAETAADLNCLLTQNNVLMRERILEFSKMPAENEELKKAVSVKETTILAQNALITKQQETLAGLEHTIQLKDQAIAEQSANISQLNAIMHTRIMRLRNVMLYQPWGARKVMHMAYLATSLMTPLVLRRKVSPLTGWLRGRFSRRPQPVGAPVETVDESSTTPVTENTGYLVKMPVTKPGAPKIAHVIANFMTGGSSRLVVDLVEYLGSDYEQFVLTSYAPNPPAYVGLQIDEQRDCNDITPFINYFKWKQPDFVHVHYWGDVDEPWYAQAIEAARVLNIPVIENINTPIAPHFSEAVKRYVYVSDYVRHVFGRPDDSHVTVYPGSDFSHFMRNDDDPVPPDCVGMVYRLERDKLNEDAIKPFIAIALKRPQTKILIVGGGSLLAPFQEAVKEAGVEAQFEFTGYVEYDTLPDYYRRMSLFIAPVWKESFGQVSPFAMNMRVPVIGYDVGAISEIVNSKAMLAPAGDAERLADIAIDLLNNDELRAMLGREHQQRAVGHFSVQAMISAYAGLYAEITEK